MKQIILPDNVAKYVATAIFVVSMIFISMRNVKFMPIGRPASALIGAVLMVFLGIVPPSEMSTAVNWDTIILLFGMMLLSGFLARDKVWDFAAAALLWRNPSPIWFLIRICGLSGAMSALLTNDAACVTLTPIVIKTCKSQKLPYLPFLMALATSSNIGSAALPVGNPQNMIIAVVSDAPFITFVKSCALAAVVGLTVNTALLILFYRKELKSTRNDAFDGSVNASDSVKSMKDVESAALLVSSNNSDTDSEDPVPSQPWYKKIHKYPSVIVVIFVLAGFCYGFNMGFTILIGVAILIVLDRKDMDEAFMKVDWNLLVFFGSLFILVDAFNRQWKSQVWDLFQPEVAIEKDCLKILLFTLFLIVGSNVLSNVPLVLILSTNLIENIPVIPNFTWFLMAFVSTVSGNCTLVGSVANLIVAEKAKKDHSISFFEYLKFGLFSSLIVIAVGVPLIVLIS